MKHAKSVVSAAFMGLGLAMGGPREAGANQELTCSGLGIPAIEVKITRWMPRPDWGAQGIVTKVPERNIYRVKVGELIGFSLYKTDGLIYAADRNGREYGSYEDIAREKAATICGHPTEPKHYRTADCKDIVGDPKPDCRRNDPWNLRVMVLRGSGISEGGASTNPRPSEGDAPVCADRSYCSGSGFDKVLAFSITDVDGANIGTSADLCRCPGRCGEVRRNASGLAEFLGDAVSVGARSIVLDKGAIRRYTPPAQGETAYLVWKPCRS